MIFSHFLSIPGPEVTGVTEGIVTDRYSSVFPLKSRHPNPDLPDLDVKSQTITTTRGTTTHWNQFNKAKRVGTKRVDALCLNKIF